MSVGERLRAAFARDDFEEMIAVLDPDVVWLGCPEPGEETPICRNRAEVRDMFEWHIAEGRRALPEIVAEGPGTIVVEMKLRAAPGEDLHQVLSVRNDRVVRIQDCAHRESAMIRAGLA